MPPENLRLAPRVTQDATENLAQVIAPLGGIVFRFTGGAPVYTTLQIFAPAALWDSAIEFESPPPEQDEIEWLHSHPEVWTQYAGQWVALTTVGICAAAYDVETVFERADECDVQDPIVFKIPASEAPKFYAND